MKKLTTITLLALALMSSAHAGSDTHAGGGIKRNGEFLTFGSAGVFPVKQYDITEELGIILETFNKIKMPTSAMSAFLKYANSSSNRKYFAVEKISLSEEVRLLSYYKEKFPDLAPGDELVVYAHTDQSTGETYLLPNFLAITDKISRAAMILHETAWVLDKDLYTPRGSWYEPAKTVKTTPKAYNQVVDLEIAFEMAARCTKNCSDKYANLISTLASQFNELGWSGKSQMIAYANLDHANGLNVRDLNLAYFISRSTGINTSVEIIIDALGREAYGSYFEYQNASLYSYEEISGHLLAHYGFAKSYMVNFISNPEREIGMRYLNITCAKSKSNKEACLKVMRIVISYADMFYVDLLDRSYGDSFVVKVREDSKEGKKLKKFLEEFGVLISI